MTDNLIAAVGTATIEETNGTCPDCLAQQAVSGSSTRCRNPECELVAPTNIFKQAHQGRSSNALQSGTSRAWTIGGAVD